VSEKVEETTKLTIRMDKMLIGDLELLDDAGRGELPAKDLVDFLDRIVEQDVRALPITMLPEITLAIQREVSRSANPETPEGN
jgi:hypothetical protein